MRLGTVAVVLGLLLAFLAGGILWKRVDGNAAAQVSEMPDERPRSTGSATAPVPLGPTTAPRRIAPGPVAPAAQAGHVPSMIRYVRGSSLFTTDAVPIERLDGWIAYRDHAQEWLRAAIQAGDPGAYELAALAHMRGDYLGMQLVARDPVRGAAYYAALVNAAAAPYREMALNKAKQAQGKLSPDQLVESERLAAQLSAALRVPPNGVDYTGGIADREDGSHCAAP